MLFPKEFQIAAKIPNVTFFSNFSSWCRLHQPTVRKKDSIRKIRVNFRSLMEKWIYCRVYKHFRCFHFILIFDVNDTERYRSEVGMKMGPELICQITKKFRNNMYISDKFKFLCKYKCNFIEFLHIKEFILGRQQF